MKSMQYMDCNSLQKQGKKAVKAITTFTAYID